MLKVHILTYSQSCFVVCASCGNRTRNQYIGPSTIRVHCLRCDQTGEWNLEEAYWTGFPEEAERNPIAQSA